MEPQAKISKNASWKGHPGEDQENRGAFVRWLKRGGRGNIFQARKEACKTNEGFCCEYKIYKHFSVTVVAISEQKLAGDEAKELKLRSLKKIISLCTTSFLEDTDSSPLPRNWKQSYGRQKWTEQIKGQELVSARAQWANEVF